jgi:pimeloyl-ACP methyl ester carboxylesterase/tetratricopeptide (TPR) repeat protein
MSIIDLIPGAVVDIAKKQLFAVGKKVAHGFIESATGSKIGEIICYKKAEKNPNVLLFVHGFSGSAADTFGATPTLLENDSHFAGWDIYSIGYSSDIFPSIGSGLWSVNPDITKVSKYLKTLIDNQFDDYGRIALVGHSMGGLAIQRMILDAPQETLQKISHLILFGTPSVGLKKARWFEFWNRQVKDLSSDSDFIKNLRKDWTNKFGTAIPFTFKTIAGSKDEFVPVESSLEPFEEKYHGIIEGNHVNMIKPKDDKDIQHQSFQIILCTLTEQQISYLQGNPEDINILLGNYQTVINKYLSNATLIGTRELTQLVFALECTNRKTEALKVLNNHPASQNNSDLIGIIGGRYKRKYLLDGLQTDLDNATNNYSAALLMAETNKDNKQIFYHAINLAFLNLLSGGNNTETKRYASLALAHCVDTTPDMYELATIAEASMYLGDFVKATEYYKKAAIVAGTDVRAKQSMYVNAFYGYQSLTKSTDTKGEFVKMLEEAFM